MNSNYYNLVVATIAGLIIIAGAAFAIPARADEVPDDGYVVACPNRQLLDELIFGEFTQAHGVCSLVLFTEVEIAIPTDVLFGDSYDAWLSGLVDLPTETLPEVSFLLMKFQGHKLYAVWPLWFMDEHWTDEDVFAENALSFGVQTEVYQEWTPSINRLPDQPVAIASIQ